MQVAVAVTFVILVLLNSLSATADWADGHYGADRPYGDLPGMPINLGSKSTAKDCYNACQNEPKCISWAFSPITCDGVQNPSGGSCWLKGSTPPLAFAEGQNCRTSGLRKAYLEPFAYAPVRLGTIAPTDWLQVQLVLQANGLSTYLSLFWADVNQSIWIGGNADKGTDAGHERAGYWLNGVVPLLAHLQAANALNKLTVDLKQQVNKFIMYILDHQLPNGWLGPDDGSGGTGNIYWQGWNVAIALLQYAQFNPDVEVRATKAVLAYIKESQRRMLQTQMTSWSQYRWQDWTYLCHMMFDFGWTYGEEQLLWDAAELGHQFGFDYNSYYDRSGPYKFPLRAVSNWNIYDHGVNHAMAIKGGAIWFRQSHDQADADQSRFRLNLLSSYHGQPNGVFAADECLGGREPNRGSELCLVVEMMQSLHHVFSVQGLVDVADLVERVAYNALPGEITPDMWAHQYLQQANEINAQHCDPHVWATDGPDSTIFGLEPNYGCCTVNFPQGWPKFVTNQLLTTQDNGIAIVHYAPFSAKLPQSIGGGATVTLNTQYPFEDTVEIDVTISSTQAVPVYFRVPTWASQAVLTVNGASPIPLKNGTMNKVLCAGKSTTKLLVEFNPQIRVEYGWGYNNSLSVIRGALVYSLFLTQNLTLLRHYQFQSNDYAINTQDAWNFGLLVNRQKPESSFQFQQVGSPGSLPFDRKNFPVVIKGKGRQIPYWNEQVNAAAPPPNSPVSCDSCGPVKEVLLVPYGTTYLRITAFPWIDSSK